jgi:hypothetical protein
MHKTLGSIPKNQTKTPQTTPRPNICQKKSIHCPYYIYSTQFLRQCTKHWLYNPHQHKSVKYKEHPVGQAQSTPHSNKGQLQFESQDQELNQIWDLQAVWWFFISFHTFYSPPSKPCPSNPWKGYLLWMSTLALMRCQKSLDRHNKMLLGISAGVTMQHMGKVTFFCQRKLNWNILLYHTEFLKSRCQNIKCAVITD